MSRLNIVVAGVPVLAHALEATGKFAKVFSVNSTDELRKLISAEIRQIPKGDLAFLFGDTLRVDTPQIPLTTLLQKLTSSGWKVLIVELSPRARDLVAAYPAAGLLSGQVSTNIALGSISGLGLGVVEPVPGGDTILDITGTAPAKAAGGWSTPPADAGWNVSEPVNRVSAPAPAAAPAPWSDAPAGAPATPWDTPASPPAPTGWDTPAPSFPAPSAPAPSGWDAPPATPAPTGWDAPAPSFPAPMAPAPGGPDFPQGAPVFPAPDDRPGRRTLRRPDESWDTPSEASAPGAWDASSFPAPTAPAPSGWDAPAPSFPAPTAPAPGGWDAPAPSFPAPTAPAPTGWDAPPTAPAPGGWEAPSFPAPSEPAPSGWGAPEGSWNGYSDAPMMGEVSGPVARDGYGAQHQVPQRRGWVITITAPKGGTGKSSLTLNLAAYLGLRLRTQGKTVCVIDTNFQQADTGKYLNVYNPNITNIVRDQTALSRERLGGYLVHRADLNISALLGPATPIDANPVFINARLYCSVLEILRELYDYILIDTPVAEKYHDIFANFALPQADYIVVPVAPNVPTLMNADAWLRTITSPRHSGGDGVDENKIGIVLNRAKEGIDCSEDEVRQELQSWRFIGSIPETDAWQRANNNSELVAPKNYQELNEAFSHVLYAATGEEALLENIHSLPSQGGGLASKLRRFVKKG